MEEELGALAVIVPKGQLSATLMIRGDQPPTPEAIYRAIAAAGVTYGILDEVVEELVTHPRAGDWVVARATPAKPGQDAIVEYFFETSRSGLAPQLLEDGRVDYFNLGAVTSVKAGQLLARKIPPVEGTPGRTVTGEEIPPPKVRDLPLHAGRGACASQDGCEVHAEGDGYPQLTRGNIEVPTVFTVDGDIDFSIGNIDFIGSVEIAGSVHKNFKVRAQGNILVHGNVEGGILEASGFIVVDGGVRGKASLLAEGDIECRFLESSVARASGNLLVKENLLFSQISVDGAIVVQGSLLGGSCTAEVSVSAASIGSKMGTLTSLVLTPREKWLRVLHGLETQLSELHADIDKIQGEVEKLEGYRKRMVEPRPEVEAAYGQLSETAVKLKQETVEVTRRALQARAKCDTPIKPKVLVQSIIHPGVQIRLNDAILNNEADLLVRVVSEEDGEITTS